MSSTEYYEKMKLIARQQRQLFLLTSPKVSITDLRKIYKHYNISFDLWPLKGIPRPDLRSLRGAYLELEHGPCVFVSRKLPNAQRIYTMAHELKHHLVDSENLASLCYQDDSPATLEIGAEIFAAELLYPEKDFKDDLFKMGIFYGKCTAIDIVRLKHNTDTTLSYASLVKRAEFMGFAPIGSLPKNGWIKLEEQLYGIPLYKRILRYRKFTSAQKAN